MLTIFYKKYSPEILKKNLRRKAQSKHLIWENEVRLILCYVPSHMEKLQCGKLESET